MTPKHEAATGCVVYWFRHDVRLHDNPALLAACAQAGRRRQPLHLVFVHDERLQQPTPWGFQRQAAQQACWWRMALDDLATQLRERGQQLVEYHGAPATVIRDVVATLGADDVWCEAIHAPEEEADIAALRGCGVTVHTVLQSTLIAPDDLPFDPQQVPDTFTTFRQVLERHGIREAVACPAPDTLPPPVPAGAQHALHTACSDGVKPDPRGSFPWDQPAFHGGERAALQHVHDYCRGGLPHTYKATRNALTGVAHSSKWSPWLATGALSPRYAMAQVRAFEAAQGANDGTYWLWFELLWRDHFRWLHLKHGRALYRWRGLAHEAPPPPSLRAQGLRRWCDGRTGHDLIDAGMRELALTGYVSNRMRQILASYLIHDLGMDWRAGAAWFESRLIDYDVHSNHGNWLYISGRGTDPRGGRRFNPDKQAQDHDPHRHYRDRWLTP